MFIGSEFHVSVKKSQVNQAVRNISTENNPCLSFQTPKAVRRRHDDRMIGPPKNHTDFSQHSPHKRYDWKTYRDFPPEPGVAGDRPTFPAAQVDLTKPETLIHPDVSWWRWGFFRGKPGLVGKKAAGGERNRTKESDFFGSCWGPKSGKFLDLFS